MQCVGELPLLLLFLRCKFRRASLKAVVVAENLHFAQVSMEMSESGCFGRGASF